MSRTSLPVVLSDAEMIRLEQWIRAGSTPQQVVLRAQIIRDAAQGQSDKTSATALGIRRETAALWRRRVREQGIGCVWEIAAGRGRKPRYAAARVGQWIDAILDKIARARQRLEQIEPDSTQPKRRSSAAIRRRARA